jgi:hypothetical protein
MALPTAGLASQTPATPGEPIDVLPAGLMGGYITNPEFATGPLYVDPVTDASTTGNGTTLALPPGQTFFAIANSTLPVSVASDEANHSFIAVQWI